MQREGKKKNPTWKFVRMVGCLWGERLGREGGAEHGTKGSPILPAMLIFKKKMGLGCSSVVQPQAYTRP